MTSSTSDTRRAPVRERTVSRSQFASPDSVWPAVLLLLLSALVIYLPNQAQIRIETGLRGLNVVNVLSILACWVMLLCQRPPSEPMPLKGPLVGLALTFSWALLVALVGDASAWVEDVTVYKNALFYPLLYILFFFAVRDLRVVRLLLALSMLMIFTSAVLGVRQALDYGIGNFNDMKRVAAPFGWSFFDANRSAVFFCIHLQLVGAAALFLKSRPVLRMACAALYAMGVFVVFFTYSRQALVILAVLALLVLARKHLLLMLAFVLALYNYEAWVPDSVVERVQMTALDPFDFETRKPDNTVWDPLIELDRPYAPEARLKKPASEGEVAATDPAAQSYDVSTESRLILWSGAWDLIKERPWGVGLNRFKREIGAHVPITMAGKDAHNVYVLFATEAGVWAPLAILGLLWGCMHLGLRLTRLEGDNEARALGNGLVMATLAVAMGNLYGSRLFDGDVMGNYWILVALSARFLVIKEAEQRRLAAARGGVVLPRGAYMGARSPLTQPVSTNR